MEHNEIKAILDKYFSGDISRDELDISIKKAYAHFLLHGFFSVDKLCIYPVLRGVLYAEDNTAIEHFYDILNGRKNDIFHFRLTIPFKSPYTEYSASEYSYKDIIADFIRMKQISYLIEADDSDALIDEFKKLANKYTDLKNVIGILSLKIFSLFRQITEYSVHIIDLHPDRSAFSSDGNLTALMQRYIECAMGERAMLIETAFLNGQPVLNISPDA